MPPRERPTVNDLGAAPAIRAVAQGTDTYSRPGQVEIGRPATTNPLLQLSAALSHLEPRLLQYHAQEMQTIAEGDVATAKEIHYGPTRDAFNNLINKQQIARGQSPFVGKLVDRLQLDQLGTEYQAEVAQAFADSPDFADARASNSPQKLNAAIEKFHSQWNMQHGFGEGATPREGDPYNRLDIQDVLTPHIDKAGRGALHAWTEYRIKTKEKEVVEAAGASMSTAIDQVVGQIPSLAPDQGHVAYSQLATRLESIMSDPLNGTVPNGAQSRTDANHMMIDALAAAATKARNPELMREVLSRMPTAGGGGRSTVADTIKARTVMQANAEHIATLEHQDAVLGEYKSINAASIKDTGLSQAEAAAQHARQTWERTGRDDHRKEDARASLTLLQHRLDLGDTEGMKAGLAQMRREGLYEEANAFEVGISTVAAARYKNISPPTHEQDMTRASLSLEIKSSGHDFDEMKLYTQLSTNRITFDQWHTLKSELTTVRELGDHEFLRNPGYKSFNTSIVDAIKSKDPLQDPFADVRELEAGQAAHNLRVASYAWIDEHPKGTQAQFLQYLSDQQEKIAAKSSTSVEAKIKERDDQLKTAKDKQDVADKQKQKDEEARLKQRETTAQVHKAEAQSKAIDAQDKATRTDEGRLILHLPDGSIETEKSITFQDKRNENRWVNFPTIFNGKHVTPEEAIRIFEDNHGVDPDTGRKVKHYYDQTTAEIAARERSNALGKKYAGHQIPTAEPDKVYPLPSNKSYKALQDDPSPENIKAFRAFFGEHSLSPDYHAPADYKPSAEETGNGSPEPNTAKRLPKFNADEEEAFLSWYSGQFKEKKWPRHPKDATFDPRQRFLDEQDS